MYTNKISSSGQFYKQFNMGDFNKNTSVRPWTLNDRRVLAESSFVYSMNLFIRSSQSFRMTCEQYLQSLNYERNDEI